MVKKLTRESVVCGCGELGHMLDDYQTSFVMNLAEHIRSARVRDDGILEIKSGVCAINVYMHALVTFQCAAVFLAGTLSPSAYTTLAKALNEFVADHGADGRRLADMIVAGVATVPTNKEPG